MIISNDIKYVGVNDHDIDLFEGQYIVPNGMAYNSYLIIDEQIALFDTVSAGFGEEWLANIKNELGDKKVDYLIIQHMEPDHSSNINLFMAEYPEAIIVSTDKSFVMMKQFFGNDYVSRRLVIKDGDSLSLGEHTLTFVTAPMVHWPEVFVTYDAKDKVLFSADAFGKFGANDVKDEDGWACEARRYYFGIVGKYGAQAQRLLAKAKTLDIKTICSLHGPVLSDNLGYYIGLYDTWTSYGVETDGVFIAYTSVYGNTKKAAFMLKNELEELGCPKVAITDLARDDIAEAVEDAFRYGKIVLATTTYNMEIFPFMRDFINELTERNFQNKTIGIIENGSWAPVAAKKIKAIFEGSKNVTFTETTVTLKSALSDDSIAEVKAMANELTK